MYTLLLLVVLGLLLKLYRVVQNRKQRPVENNRQPVPLRRRVLLQEAEEDHNNSVSCNRKRATEHDEN